MLSEVVIIGGGCTMTVFSLGILLVRQWKRKSEWRKQGEDHKKMKEGSPKSNTSTVQEMKIVTYICGYGRLRLV